MSSDVVLLVARLLMAVLFLGSGLPKLLGEPQQRAAIAGLGFPAPGLLERLTGAGLMAAALLLVAGAWTRPATALLALFMIVITPLFHRFWGPLDPQERSTHAQAFFANVAIIGGLLALYAAGPGSLALSPAM